MIAWYPADLVDAILFDLCVLVTLTVFAFGAFTGKPTDWMAVTGGTVGLGIWPNLRKH